MPNIITPKTLSGIVVEGGEALSIFEVSKYKCKLEISRENAQYVRHNIIISRPLSSNPLDGSYEAEWDSHLNLDLTLDPHSNLFNQKQNNKGVDAFTKTKQKRGLLRRRSGSKSKVISTDPAAGNTSIDDSVNVSIVLTYAGDAITQLGDAAFSMSELCKPEHYQKQKNENRGVISISFPVQRRNIHIPMPTRSNAMGGGSSAANVPKHRRFELTRSASLSLTVEDTDYGSVDMNSIIPSQQNHLHSLGEQSATTMVSIMDQDKGTVVGTSTSSSISSESPSRSQPQSQSTRSISNSTGSASSPLHAQPWNSQNESKRYLKHLIKVSLRAVSASEKMVEQERTSQEQSREQKEECNPKQPEFLLLQQGVDASTNTKAEESATITESQLVNGVVVGSSSNKESSPLKSLMTMLLDIQPCGGVDSNTCSKTCVGDDKTVEIVKEYSYGARD